MSRPLFSDRDINSSLDFVSFYPAYEFMQRNIIPDTITSQERSVFCYKSSGQQLDRRILLNEDTKRTVFAVCLSGAMLHVKVWETISAFSQWLCAI